jgi:hypothetical protein
MTTGAAMGYSDEGRPSGGALISQALFSGATAE